MRVVGKEGALKGGGRGAKDLKITSWMIRKIMT